MSILVRALLSGSAAMVIAAPVFAGSPYFGPRPAMIVNQSQSVNVDVTPSDVDDDVMSVTATGLPPGMSLTSGAPVPALVSAGPYGSPSAQIIAFGPNDSLYYNSQNKVFRIDTNGTVTHIAGSGTAGHVDGAGLSAQFSQIAGLTVDSGGNVFLAERNVGNIRKISAAGTVSTVFDGAYTPQHMFRKVYAANGNVYAAVDGGAVYKFPASTATIPLASWGNYRFAGTGQAGFSNGPAATSKLRIPGAIAADNANGVYILDTSSKTLRYVNSAGQMSVAAGQDQSSQMTDGPLGTNRMTAPHGMARKPDGTILIVDHAQLRQLSGGQLQTLITSPQLGQHHSIAADSNGNVYGVANGQIKQLGSRPTSWAITGTYAGGNCGGNYKVMVTATDDQGNQGATSVDMNIPAQGPGCGGPPPGPGGVSGTAATTGANGGRTIGSGTVVTRPTGGAATLETRKAEPTPCTLRNGAADADCNGVADTEEPTVRQRPKR